jgi:hypothetical protein
MASGLPARCAASIFSWRPEGTAGWCAASIARLCLFGDQLADLDSHFRECPGEGAGSPKPTRDPFAPGVMAGGCRVEDERQMNGPAREERVSGTSACHVQQPRGKGVYNRFQRRGEHMSHAAKTIARDPAMPSAVAFAPKHARRAARPAALHYTPQFAALLGVGGTSAEIARIKSPAFAASLSNGREGNRHRQVAIGALLACILVAGSAAALWQFGGNRTARAPGFAGTLVVADSSDVAAPAARAAAFDVEAGASDPLRQTSAGGLAGYPAAPAPANAAPPRRTLQAAIDAAPFRSSILGIATAGLPVGSGTASGPGPAAADPSPGPTFDSDAAADLSPALSSSSANGGQSPPSSAVQGGELPSASAGRADDPVEDRGHREADRSNYLAAFAREAFRTTATVDTVARSLRPDSTGVPNADNELDSASDPAASQDSSDGPDQAADGSAAADRNASGAEGGGDLPASGKHQRSGPTGEQHVADASSKADNDPSIGGGAEAADTSDTGSGIGSQGGTSAAADNGSPGSSAKHKGASGPSSDDHVADSSAKADGDPGSGNGLGDADSSSQGPGNHAGQGQSAGSNASASGGSADGGAAAGSAGATGDATASDASGKSGKGAKSDGGDTGDSGQTQGGQDAGGSGQNGKSQEAHGKSDGGDTAGQDGASAQGDGGQNGGEGSDGGDAGPAGKGHGDPGGGDQGGGKGHGGKGNGGKDHGGKGGG